VLHPKILDSICSLILLHIGNKISANRCSPQMVDVAVRVKDVKCGLDSSMFLTSTGTLLACGRCIYVVSIYSTYTHIHTHTMYFIQLYISIHKLIPPVYYSNRYNKLGLNQRTTFRMQVKSLWNKVWYMKTMHFLFKCSVCMLHYIHTAHAYTTHSAHICTMQCILYIKITLLWDNIIVKWSWLVLIV